MGDSWEGEWSFAQVEELAREAFFRNLEFDAIVFDVVYLEGEKWDLWGYGMLEGATSWVFYRDFVWLVTDLGTHIYWVPPNVFRVPFLLYIVLCLFCIFVATSCFFHLIVFF